MYLTLAESQLPFRTQVGLTLCRRARERHPLVTMEESVRLEYNQLSALTEASRLKKLGAVMRAVSVLMSPPLHAPNTDAAPPPIEQTVAIPKPPFQDKPQKKSGPQPLQRRPR